jgi:hypothetical protein
MCLKNKNWNPPKNDYDMDFMKIWLILGHSKVHDFFWLIIF